MHLVSDPLGEISTVEDESGRNIRYANWGLASKSNYHGWEGRPAYANFLFDHPLLQSSHLR